MGRRRLLTLAGALAASGCMSMGTPPGPGLEAARMEQNAFTMPDGARLPYRAWLPEDRPQAVVLALHGFNDSRDAWEMPAPYFAASGIALYSPDQRGFGQAPDRGLWPGTDRLVADAAEMARQVRAMHPGVPLVLMGESMGAAVLMVLATGPLAPADARYLLIAPAVWGRARMNLFLRSGLWLVVSLMPGLAMSRGPVQIMASDNHEALVRLTRDPLTIKRTRMDALGGLVDLMDAALAAAPRFRAPSLFQYGGKDELVPKAATAFTWQALPRGSADGPRLAYYPNGYHLLLRDLGRVVPIGDAIAWIRDPAAPLPSGAEHAAAQWLEAQS
ncbi:alpha/beta fold hydrolase [Rhodovastum atsumiense]|nr:alpha/beta fold hydrolase [Rhodovastum atsumiense]